MSNLSPLIETYLKQSQPLVISDNLSIQDLRNQFNERQRNFNCSAPTYNLAIREETAATPQGEIPLRIYRPKTSDVLSALVFFHGGGFVFGNLDTLESYCREISHFANCIVISVDYPLAPEHPFPAALDAAYAALKWIEKRLETWHGEQIFIGGSSSGATLAAVTAMMIRDQGGPKICGQILLCPLTDANFDTESYRQCGLGYNLTREHCRWFLSKYAPDSTYLKNPRLVPLQESNFKDLPPALIVTAEFDPLRDDGLGFAQKLKAAGVPCKDLCYKGMIHGFSTLPLDLPEKKDVLNQIHQFVSGIKASNQAKSP